MTLNLHVSTPMFFKNTVKAYVFPSFSTPKSTLSGRSSNPLRSWKFFAVLRCADATEEVLTFLLTGSSTKAN